MSSQITTYSTEEAITKVLCEGAVMRSFTTPPILIMKSREHGDQIIVCEPSEFCKQSNIRWKQVLPHKKEW